ncbi:cache domain-containing protein [Magnetospirillum sp. 64-120]|uniref:cache domain-containing protein n=1 Tax=Magnetospirillum sp. 64-120 TaxID=1895778 RepID=UPI000A803465|nr:cache domain-containing protein [Magnetospirillum sp. 64-120]
MSTRRISLIDHLFLRLALVAGGGILCLCLVWAGAELYDFNLRSDELRQSHRNASQVLLKRVVDDALQTIAYERRRVEARVEAGLRDRIDEAELLASNLIKTYRDTRSMGEIEVMVRESLRPIRFNRGRGYYFAFDLTGVEKLFPLRPELEGTDMLDQKGARGEYVVRDMLELVRNNGGGLYRYYWPHPTRIGDHLKFAYVRPVMPIGWVIGTGEYVADMEDDIKAEVLERLSHLSFDRDGYVFVSQMDGLSLVGALKGRNPLNGDDPVLRDGTQALIDTAKAGGGFVSYDMMDAKGRMTRKTSYVAGIPEWNWFVGAGLHDDRVEEEIDIQRQRLLLSMLIKGGVAAFAAFLVGLAGVVIMRATSRRAAADGLALSRNLAAAASSPEPIDTEHLRFAEHLHFAEAANQLIERRAQVENELLARTAQLEQTNADLERFAYVASHDLQEPLRTIGLFMQLLKRRLGDNLDDEAQEYIDYAIGGADRMRTNIQGLLAYSRSTQHNDDRVATDMEALVGRVVADLSGAIVATGAQVDIDPLPVLRVNPDQMAALFQNLIGNALRYRHPERTPHVVVGASQGANGGWEIVVADNGIGVPEDYRTAIFEPFRRFQPPGVEGGSGIGLAICRKVVQDHGGRIWVESDDTGSRFHFTIGDGCVES